MIRAILNVSAGREFPVGCEVVVDRWLDDNRAEISGFYCGRLCRAFVDADDISPCSE